jgi:protein-S-isoprenylcysteine O-methyltransferase Ste14
MGGWLFRHRTLIPVPLAAVILIAPAPASLPPSPFWLAGAALIAGGEGLRLWAVHHIGAISRTRSERLGPLVASGPFSLVRNPLYLGNVALWAGFAISARLLWLTPLLVAALALEYHAIVQWEEQLLAARLGDPYREYTTRVPRWMPSRRRATVSSAAPHSWHHTFFSERGTLIAIAVGYALLYAKVIVKGTV